MNLSLPITQPVAIFLLVLLIILLAPITFRRLKIPYIAGMIIAGVIVGPYGFNILARDASFEIFGQVGILYLMFLAAVEIDLENLRRNYGKGLMFGLITFLIPMGVGIFASRWAFHASWSTAVLIGSMYASHTLISYPIVNRFGLAASRSVIIAVSSTVVAVLLSLLALAIVVDITEGGQLNLLRTSWLLVRTVLYGVGVAIVFPWITRRFFRATNDMIYQFIFVLMLVFVASLLAQMIGLESILGAFYAGLVLNKFIPSRSGLMNRIEFAGNAIFIPYFLIGVGMLINVRAAVQGWGVAWVAVNMIVTALVCKWVAAFIGQKLFGFTAVGRRVLFGLTSGKAAATIAATIVGYKYGIISEDMMNGAVLMILVCCGVASVVTERGALKLRINLTSEDLKRDSRAERRNARQVVAVSNPVSAEGIMKVALYMRHPKNRLPITALFVRNSDSEASAAMGRRALQIASETAIAMDITVKDVDRYDLNIATGILNTVKEQDATDIIIGMHHKGNMVDTFFGAMVESLLKSTNRMVIMSRCFLPVNTLRRVFVLVPEKAEYETGFRQWVERMGNMGSQLGCRIQFIANAHTIPYIEGVLRDDQYSIRQEFVPMTSWDDFITISGEIEDEDLLMVICARRGSVSFTSDMENIPNFLSRYFNRHNIMLIFPKQFGSQEEMPAPIDPLAEAPTEPTAWALATHWLRARVKKS